MIIAIETDTALGYTFTPLAPAGYRAPLQPGSRYPLWLHSHTSPISPRTF